MLDSIREATRCWPCGLLVATLALSSCQAWAGEPEAQLRKLEEGGITLYYDDSTAKHAATILVALQEHYAANHKRLSEKCEALIKEVGQHEDAALPLRREHAVGPERGLTNGVRDTTPARAVQYPAGYRDQRR